ncbi:hypothetical protein GJ496_000349 [Pomphorhynchus laevis]|nr:hypothetical protein GJ496_000349 [Pomphorhynchus laevis]
MLTFKPCLILILAVAVHFIVVTSFDKEVFKDLDSEHVDRKHGKNMGAFNSIKHQDRDMSTVYQVLKDRDKRGLKKFRKSIKKRLRKLEESTKKRAKEVEQHGKKAIAPAISSNFLIFCGFVNSDKYYILLYLLFLGWDLRSH